MESGICDRRAVFRCSLCIPCEWASISSTPSDSVVAARCADNPGQDGTILATAIPRITNVFNSLNDVGWYGSSYLFTNCTVQLLFGKLYTYYSVKWVFLNGLLVFEIGSLICGIAPNSPALIVGRSIAGLGSAGLFAGALLIVSNTVPLRVRPIYIGLVSSMHGVASVAGPMYVIESLHFQPRSINLVI